MRAQTRGPSMRNRLLRLAFVYPVFLHFPDGSLEICTTDQPGAVQVGGSQADIFVVDCRDDKIFANGFEP